MAQQFKHILIIALLIFTLPACQKDQLFQQSRIAMDTLATITVVSASSEEAEKAIQAGFAEIERLGMLLDYFSESSELTAINKGAGKSPVKVSKETLEVIKRAVEVAEMTEGAYDPTVGPVVSLWDFVKSKKPDHTVLETKLHLVDYRKVHIDQGTVYLEQEGMELDLGGIAKGYGADKAINVIKSLGVQAALVSIAGDIRGYGLKPDSTPWRIGIQNPRAKSDKDNILASLPLKDLAISTSGDYQRYFIENGTRYHHLLVPQTGMPAKGLISVSLVAKEGVLADALSTGIFVLGMDKGLKIMKHHGVEGLFVDENQKIFVTPDMAKTLETPEKYIVINE